MTEKNKTNKGKRLSKGLRMQIRRLKQEAQKEGTVYRAPIEHSTPVKKEE